MKKTKKMNRKIGSQMTTKRKKRKSTIPRICLPMKRKTSKFILSNYGSCGRLIFTVSHPAGKELYYEC